MKICLVSPPTLVEFNERVMAESEAARLIFEHAPMGILSLAAVLDQDGADIEILDLNRLYHDFITGGHKQKGIDFCFYAGAHLENSAADVFGFSTICSSYPLTLRLAQRVRVSHPDSLIILGGPQASVVDEETLRRFSFVDLIVRGEAEETLPRVIDSFSSRERRFDQITGVTYRRGNAIERNPNAPVIEDLDQLPMPAFHLYPHTNDSGYIPLEAGRGCPFACSFCSTNDFFRRRFRMKSPEVLVEQMKTVALRYKINSFDLIHDMFTVDRKIVVAFCEALARSGEELYWGCSARTDCIDDELIDLMVENGCNGLFFGIDSGSERVQSLIHKRLNLADAAMRIKRVNRARIKHTVSLITGFPEETKEDLRGTIQFIGDALRHEHAEIQLHLLAPLAETPITSEYQDRLIYDEIFSDISFQGWEQNPEERAMIMDHPKLFPNFYAVPTRWLERQYLRELREFILHGTAKLRWSLASLHRDSGDLLQVFDQWLAWSIDERDRTGEVDTSRKYYAGDHFPRDFARFVMSHYLADARYPHLVKTILAVESARCELKDSDYDRAAQIVIDSLDCVPRVATEARLLIVNADYQRIIRSLKRRETFDRIVDESVPLGLLKRNDRLKIFRLNEASYELMKLCDGSRSINQIAGEFSASKEIGVSPLKASIYGLASLAQQGLVEIPAAA